MVVLHHLIKADLNASPLQATLEPTSTLAHFHSISDFINVNVVSDV